ncbi:MAG TPA: hypothetical protein VGD67_03360 [Pseudonocardiaceae bacterium]
MTALDRLLGGALLVASPVLPGALALFDAKAELVRLSHELVAAVPRGGRRRRQDRTRQLEAAHAVLTVVAFFEAVAEARLPFPATALELRRAEQDELARRLLVDPAVGPLAEPDRESNLAALGRHYEDVAGALRRFVAGLSVWDGLDERQRAAFEAALVALPDRAVARYVELLDRLAVEFPEVARWLGRAEADGVRRELGRIGSALEGLESRLAEIAGGGAPDERRAALARAYRAALERPVLDSEETDVGFVVPSLRAAYVDPRFRAAEAGPGRPPSEESWWAPLPVREDLDDFLTGYLTSSRATAAPLLVLGQPGSGKSKLTQVLPARLPATDFLPVRVPLRDVPAVDDVQQQIEAAIRSATGESLSWPELVRSAGDALPVVLLDGFDELLQATGVSQSDYLARVRDFQRREADQGRPVAVLVTSRTAVADRARIPDGSVVLRLEPFSDEQVARWLAAWNEANAAVFAARGVAGLDAATALRYPELAGQPLLLIMLAIYDADTNALQGNASALSRNDLYERLLTRFARRQVTTLQPSLAGRDLDQAVEQELQRLSMAALAMFNRGGVWVTSADLDKDLAALAPAPRSVAPQSFQAPLSQADLTIGRFFFVHRSSARHDQERIETYEFLHATFGEFLIARYVWQIAGTLTALDRVARDSPLGGGTLDDGLLHAVLSFAPLTFRKPIVEFLCDRAAGTADRQDRTDLLVRLFRAAHVRRPERSYADYEPVAVGVPRRHAAYTANLVLLAVIAAGELPVSRLFDDPERTIDLWHRETLLWRSQLDNLGEWTGFVFTFAARRVWEEHRDLVLSIDADRTFRPARIDVRWTYQRRMRPDEVMTNASQQARRLLRKANFICGPNEDVMGTIVEPFDDEGHGLNTFLHDDGIPYSLARLAIDEAITRPLPGSIPRPNDR